MENTAITTAKIDSNCRFIGYEAFEYCDRLTSVVIGNSVTSIGSDAFSWCASLTSVEIPDSVKSIGDYAFRACSKLTSIRFNGTVAKWMAISKGDYWHSDIPATEVICTDGTVAI